MVGVRTWGKGTVQNIIRMQRGKSALKLTTASYWRPSGKNIHRKKDAKLKDEWGVSPDKGMKVTIADDVLKKVVKWRRFRDIVRYPDETKDDIMNHWSKMNGPINEAVDPQLKKAIDVAIEQIDQP